MLKTGVAWMTQFTKEMTSALARDERIKDLLDACAMEHFEIACYLALAAAAEKADLPMVAETCRGKREGKGVVGAATGPCTRTGPVARRTGSMRSRGLYRSKVIH